MIVESTDGIQGMKSNKVKDGVYHLIVKVTNQLLIFAEDRRSTVLDLHNIIRKLLGYTTYHTFLEFLYS